MDNDIDIEEHNILEDPALKAIFPDITVLKQELDDENEAFDSCLNSETDHTNSEINHEIRPDSYAAEHHEQEQRENDIQIRDNLFGNKIILGTKPRKRHPGYYNLNEFVKLKKVKLTLPDVSMTLLKSKNFCEDCLILFPSAQSFMTHCRISHKNFLCNQISKTNMNMLRDKDEIERLNKKSKLCISDKASTETCYNVPCFHCSLKFADKKSLIEHLYKVLEPKLNKNNNKNEEGDPMDKSHDTVLNKKDTKSNSSGCTEMVTDQSPKITLPSEKIKEELYTQCHICMYYFKYEKFYIQHMYNKHSIHNSTNKVKFNSKCTYCLLKCNNMKSYNKHLYNKHKVDILEKINNLKNKNKEKCIEFQSIDSTKNEKTTKDKININESKSELFFQCHVCSYYFKDEKYFSQHMLKKHRIKQLNKRKVMFSPICVYCSLKCNNSLKSYNTHIFNKHKANIMETMNKLNNESKQKLCSKDKGSLKPSNKNNKIDDITNILVPRSTLYKCCKCDIHFISPSLALDHIQHMEILINWKCSICNLIFKRNESQLHIKQHQFSLKFNVLQISDNVFSKLLYCCPKCAIHFQENNFVRHYGTCEEHTPQSVHCKVCDILIDSEIKSSHQDNHSNGSMNKDDFVIIDLFDKDIRRRKIRKKIVKKRKTIQEKLNIPNIDAQNYHLYYCKTCKCFVSKVHKVDVHRKSQCTQIIKYPCKFCGLILTGKGIMTHRSLHIENKNLKLQDFTFYNLQNGKKISPPIPDLPKCESCNLHFLYRNDIRSHVCMDSGDNKNCTFCGIILRGEAYKVHLPFHKYEINGKQTNDEYVSASCVSSVITSEPEFEECQTVKNLNSDIDEDPPVVYCCKVCSIHVNSYDEVIEHCQLHLTSSEMNVKNESYNTNEGVKIFYFDIYYYGSSNDVWLQQVYGSLSVDQINKFLLTSIYKDESRIKMEILQEGNPKFTEYKCETCHCFVDSLSMFKHISNCITNPKKYTCEVCKLPFITKNMLNNHMKIHSQVHISKSSFRIISFNKPEHKQINEIIKLSACRPYVVYRCRNCEGLVNKSKFDSHICNLNKLKKCENCGLLLYDIEYESHVSKHKQLESFNGNNIKVVLLGYNVPNASKQATLPNVKSSFIGIVCDYSFYKCSKCEICIRDFRSTSKHFCLVDCGKAKCKKCDLYFDEGKLKGHYKLHTSDPDFVKENIFTISFDPCERGHEKHLVKEICQKDDVSKSSKNNRNVEAKEKGHILEERVTQIYRCVKCNFHFLSEGSVKEHIKKGLGRSLSQQCTKCGFAFSPNNLFKHLLEHHGQKNIIYKFEVVDVTGDFKKHKIYKCSKCSLHFTNSKKMFDHYLKCLGDSTDGEKCKCCGIMFHFSYLLNHERMHENNTHVDYQIVSTEELRSSE